MADRVEKPWGYYEDLYRHQDVVLKRITIAPGEQLSYQTHQQRQEFWKVQSGTGKVRTSDADNPLASWRVDTMEPGVTFIIPNGLAHQIINDGETDLVIYETQVGLCDENDIERIEDPYDR